MTFVGLILIIGFDNLYFIFFGLFIVGLGLNSTATVDVTYLNEISSIFNNH